MPYKYSKGFFRCMIAMVLFASAEKVPSTSDLREKRELAEKYEREALRNEDAFMAAHLVSEGYKVIPPDAV